MSPPAAEPSPATVKEKRDTQGASAWGTHTSTAEGEMKEQPWNRYRRRLQTENAIPDRMACFQHNELAQKTGKGRITASD
jgi:hypothetical protein